MGNYQVSSGNGIWTTPSDKQAIDFKFVLMNEHGYGGGRKEAVKVSQAMADGITARDGQPVSFITPTYAVLPTREYNPGLFCAKARTYC